MNNKKSNQKVALFSISKKCLKKISGGRDGGAVVVPTKAAVIDPTRLEPSIKG